MNQRFASAALTVASTVAAFGFAAAMVAGKAYAGDITIDPTVFVSTLSRAEVRADVMAHRDAVSAARGEGIMGPADTPLAGTMLTRAQARSDYVAARDEVRALTAEDSGSTWLARRAMPADRGTTVAGADR